MTMHWSIKENPCSIRNACLLTNQGYIFAYSASVCAVICSVHGRLNFLSLTQSVTVLYSTSLCLRLCTTAKCAAPIVTMLHEGMRLSQEEFRVLYEKSDLRKVELVQGKVSMPSPVNGTYHGEPHVKLIGWLYMYESFYPNVAACINASVKLDANNELQPDVLLRKKDGACIADANGNFCGAPELVGEISNTSVHFDSHGKKYVYEMCGVKEYIIWRTGLNQLEWFVLRNGRYHMIEAVDGLITSETFPGLVLNVTALMEGNTRQVIETLMTAINER